MLGRAIGKWAMAVAALIINYLIFGDIGILFGLALGAILIIYT